MTLPTGKQTLPFHRILMTVLPIALALAFTVSVAVYVPPIRDSLESARSEYGKLFVGFLVASSIMAVVFTVLMGIILWNAHGETVDVESSEGDSEDAGR